jgi:hypothetical protein
LGHVSPRTVASYRHSLKLLLAFAQQRTGKPPNALDWADLDAALITTFLQPAGRILPGRRWPGGGVLAWHGQ